MTRLDEHEWDLEQARPYLPIVDQNMGQISLMWSMADTMREPAPVVLLLHWGEPGAGATVLIGLSTEIIESAIELPIPPEPTLREALAACVKHLVPHKRAVLLLVNKDDTWFGYPVLFNVLLTSKGGSAGPRE